MFNKRVHLLVKRILIADARHGRTQFLNCVGAVDGKYIRIKMPSGNVRLFYSCKHFSILLSTSVDTDCCFIAVAVGADGKSGDSNVFKNSLEGSWS